LRRLSAVIGQMAVLRSFRCPTPDTATDEILAVIAADQPHGATADQVARAVGLGLNGEVVQSLLEELVVDGLLDRRGIGDGAVYTLNPLA